MERELKAVGCSWGYVAKLTADMKKVCSYLCVPTHRKITTTRKQIFKSITSGHVKYVGASPEFS